MLWKNILFFILGSSFTLSDAHAAGHLSDNIRIKSQILGYDLQYRVYTPDGVKAGDLLPTIYITDGQWYLSQGHFDETLDKEIARGIIEPVIAVFIDNRNPDKLTEIRRNQEFFCKEKYVGFFVKELVPHIDKTYPTTGNRENRVILGMSFGGLNSACFGLMAYNTFKGIAMQSPASDEHVNLMSKLYKDEEKKPVKMFMSVGTKNDNTSAGRKFKRVLLKKGYDLSYYEVNKGHNWKNWQPLFDEVLQTFFARESNDD